MSRAALMALAALAGCTAAGVEPPVLAPDMGTSVIDAGAQPGADAARSDSGSAGLDAAVAQDSGVVVITRDAGAADSGSDQGCEGPNPAQCTSDEECPGEQLCDRSGCRPSACSCLDGEWLCTPDCGGGICREPDQQGCEGSNPQGCAADRDCGQGFVCDRTPCVSSRCSCSEAQWSCTRDCGGGRCVGGEGICEGVAAPSGCSQFGCPEGQRCVRDRNGCEPSSCFCERGGWTCTEDCGGGGECRPN